MKKSEKPVHLFCKKKNQIFLTMKFLAVFILLCSSQLNAVVYSQTAQVTLNLKDASFKEFVAILEKTTDYTFLYSDAEVKKLNNLNIQCQNADLRQVLNDCLQKVGLSYRMMNNTIVITQASASPQTPQSVKISGQVVDIAQRPLPGVTVILKGTTIGTATDTDGKFELLLPTNIKPVLLFSFIGMKEQEITVKEGESLKIIMEENIEEMEEVVVTGIFNKSRESYTGAVTSISSKELKIFKGQNMLSTIKNIDPAFNIVANNITGSNPNVIPEINIRGNSSLPMSMDELNNQTAQALNQPLIIMDGFEISLQKLMDFNDEDIENINILKDASATAIYGSRGANGVIVITTKTPKAGKLKAFAKAGFSLEMPDLSSYNLLNAKEKLALEKEVGLYENSGKKDPHKEQELEEKYYAILKEVLRGVDTYWLSKPLHIGVGQKYNVRLEGGSQEFRWGAGISYNSIQGVMIGSERNTFSGTISLAYTYKNLLFQNQTILDYNHSAESKYGGFSTYAQMNPYWTPRDEAGNLILYYTTIGGSPIANPLYDASLNTKNESKYDRLINNFSIEWNISKSLKLRGQIGISKGHNSRDIFLPAEHSSFNSSQEWNKTENFFRKGKYTYVTGESSNLESRVTVSYSNTFAEKHLIYAGFDWSLSNSKEFDYTIVGEGFSNQDHNFLGNALQYAKNGRPTGYESVSRQVGFTGNINYTYDNRYYADFSYRTDGSSQFGSNKRFAPFYSIGVGWNLHHENFLKNQETVNTLRLRASYGKTGSQQFSSYQALRTYQYYTDERYLVWNGANLIGLGNENLKWQITDQYDFGIEIGMLKHRLSVNFDIYQKKTSNLLSQMDLPLANGFSSYADNVGEVNNIGFEAHISGYAIQNTEKGIIWMLSGKLAYTKNEITRLSEALKRQTEEYKKKNVEINRLLYEGHSQYAIYAVPSLGIDPSTGRELYFDAQGHVTPTWNPSAKQYFGQKEPKFRGNFTSLFSYKDLSLNLNFGFHWGGQQYNETLLNKVEVTNNQIQYNVDRRVWAERWQKPGDLKPFKGYGNNKTKASSRFVMDDNVFELQSASLQYYWHSKFIKSLNLESIRFDVNMSDVFYISSIKRERGTSYPFARRIEFSLGLTF